MTGLSKLSRLKVVVGSLPMHIYFRGDLLQRLRLSSGLVLLAFAGSHFLNHALGLLGLEVMHLAQAWRTAVTRSVPGSLVLLVAFLTHVALGLYKIAVRQTWRMPPWEFAQITTGLLIPFLLLPHIINTRFANIAFGVEDSYLYELKRLWPASALQQSVLLLLVWVHGCIGLHHWLRLDERYRRLRPLLATLAIALPLLALAGFVFTGQTTANIMSDAQSLAALKERSNWPSEAADAVLAQWRAIARIAFASIAVVVLLVPAGRYLRRRHVQGMVRITYSSGATVTVAAGQTLLEASRAHGVHHASVCGGRARCSTCRVRIERGRESLPPPDDAELLTLQAIGAPEDVRLACQLRPTSDLTVALVSAPRTPGPVQSAFDDVGEVVVAHARARALGRLVERACKEPSKLVLWFRDRLGRHVSFPSGSLAHSGLSGGRIDYLGDQAVAVAVFALGSEYASVFMSPEDGAESYMVRATHHGYHVLGWSNEHARYIAVGSVPQVALERLASSLAAYQPSQAATDARQLL